MAETQGSRVKEVREHLKLNQTAFAKSIGITQGAIWQIENDNGVSLETLTKIANIHHVSISWLLEGKGEMLVKKKTEEQPTSNVLDIIERMREDHRKEKEELYKVIADYRQTNNDYRSMLVNSKVLPSG